MDIHRPKAAHSIREFLIEIGTIICGILIALGLEQGVEWFHWRGEVAAGREHLREEIAFNERVYVHRFDVAACVKQNLGDLKSVVAKLEGRKPVSAIPEFQSPGNGPIRHEIWNSLNAAQVLVHFPKDELTKYSEFYQYIRDAEYFMDRESRAWRQLHLLEGDPGQLTRQDISALRVALGDSEEMSNGLAEVAQTQVDLGRELGIAIPKPDPSRRRECARLTQPGGR